MRDRALRALLDAYGPLARLPWGAACPVDGPAIVRSDVVARARRGESVEQLARALACGPDLIVAMLAGTGAPIVHTLATAPCAGCRRPVRQATSAVRRRRVHRTCPDCAGLHRSPTLERRAA